MSWHQRLITCLPLSRVWERRGVCYAKVVLIALICVTSSASRLWILSGSLPGICTELSLHVYSPNHAFLELHLIMLSLNCVSILKSGNKSDNISFISSTYFDFIFRNTQISSIVLIQYLMLLTPGILYLKNKRCSRCSFLKNIVDPDYTMEWYVNSDNSKQWL